MSGADFVIEPQTANEEFDRWASAWDLDLVEDDLSEEERSDLVDIKRRIVRKIRQGRLLVSDDGSILTYKLGESIGKGEPLEELVIKMPRGSTYLATDRGKEGKPVAKAVHFMASMTGQPEEFFKSRMRGDDFKVLQAITQLFLSS